MNLAPLPALPIEFMRLDPDVSALETELKWVIASAVVNDPRSLQKRIGISEVGTPCTRKLVYALGECEPVNDEGVAWRAAVGRAVHSWLAEVFTQENQRIGWRRYLVESRVSPGLINGVPLSGSSDIFDLLTGTVVDWKIPGQTSMKRVRRKGVDQGYRVQGHTYGLGFERAGLLVRRVAIVFLPSAGEFRDAIVWSEEYDRDLALRFLNRANTLAELGAAMGFEQLAALAETYDDYCTYCPFYAPMRPDPLRRRCGGIRDERVQRVHEAGHKLIPPSGNPLEVPGR